MSCSLQFFLRKSCLPKEAKVYREKIEKREKFTNIDGNSVNKIRLLVPLGLSNYRCLDLRFGHIFQARKLPCLLCAIRHPDITTDPNSQSKSRRTCPGTRRNWQQTSSNLLYLALKEPMVKINYLACSYSLKLLISYLGHEYIILFFQNMKKWNSECVRKNGPLLIIAFWLCKTVYKEITLSQVTAQNLIALKAIPWIE